MSFSKLSARLSKFGARPVKLGVSDRGLLILIFVVLLGFDLRLEGALRTVVDFPLRADAQEYYFYALNLREHGVYSRSPDALFGSASKPPADALRPPLYPLALYAFVTNPPTQSSVTAILVAQAILGTISLVIIFYLFRRFLGEALALVGTALTAMSPHLITLTHYVLTEILFSVLLLAMVFVLAIKQMRPGVRLASVGALLAAAALTRPSAQYFLVLLAGLFFLHMNRKSATRASLFLLLGFALAFLPWVGRNLVSLGTTGDSTLAVYTLHHGIYPNFTYEGVPESYGFPYRADPRTREIAQNYGTVLAEIKRRFESDPARHLHWYLVGKPVAFWSWNIVQGMGDIFIYPVISTPYRYLPQFQTTRAVMKFLHWPLVILAVLGCLLAWMPQRKLPFDAETLIVVRTMSLILIYFTALHVVGTPFPRYSIPLRPILYGTALLPIGLLVNRIRMIPGFRTPFSEETTKIDNSSSDQNQLR